MPCPYWVIPVGALSARYVLVAPVHYHKTTWRVFHLLSVFMGFRLTTPDKCGLLLPIDEMVMVNKIMCPSSPVKPTF